MSLPAAAATWGKSGASPAVVAKAIATCRKYVADNFDEDDDYGNPTGRTPDSERLLNREQAREEMFDRCMKRLGFVKAR